MLPEKSPEQVERPKGSGDPAQFRISVELDQLGSPLPLRNPQDPSKLGRSPLAAGSSGQQQSKGSVTVEPVIAFPLESVAVQSHPRYAASSVALSSSSGGTPKRLDFDKEELETVDLAQEGAPPGVAAACEILVGR